MSHLTGQVPLRLLSAEFTDVEQMCEAIRTWDLDFRPLAMPTRPSRIGSITQWRFEPGEITHACFSASFEQRGAPPGGAVTFGVLAAHMRRLWWRGREVDSGTVPVFPVASELHSISGPDFEVFTISVREETIARVCEQCELPLPPAHQRPETFRASPGQLDRLRQQLRRLTDPLGGDAPMEARQVTENLVATWLGPIVASLPRPSLRSRDQAMRRCLERLEHPDWTALSTAQLCEIAGVGERTLQYAFRERFGLTPAAFLKARRLAIVRQRLLRGEPGQQTVGDAATSLGFWHLSHFAEDYRHAFGEAPSETLKRSLSA